jgi:hypothetical protein
MNGLDEGVKRRLGKLLALAERGEGGEKDNAQRILDKVLKKHGLTMEDLRRPDRQRYKFAPRDANDTKILYHAAWRVLKVSDFSMWKYRDRRGTRGLDLTPLEFAEVQFLWELYRAQWRKEQERLLTAFLVKHKLFGETSGDSEHEWTPAELERLRRLVESLETVREHKPLEHKK